MKQEEKSRKSRDHILSCAFTEFAEQGYLRASVNTICSSGNISKGLLYHYYTDKDALYLACVGKCYLELTNYLCEHLNVESVTPDQYFDVRLAYFIANPLHQKLFCDTVVNPPQHLCEELSVCRAAFDSLNDKLLTVILEKEKLAEGITIHDALRQIRVFEDFVSTYLKNAGQEAREIEEHNNLCRQTFQTMFYGLVARM